jgi:hypothetical protein
MKGNALGRVEQLGNSRRPTDPQSGLFLGHGLSGLNGLIEIQGQDLPNPLNPGNPWPKTFSLGKAREFGGLTPNSP